MAARLGSIPSRGTLADDFEADLGNTAQPVQTRRDVVLEPEDRRSAALAWTGTVAWWVAFLATKKC